MRLAITGATGFIGRSLVKELSGSEKHLILLGRAMDRLSAQYGEGDPQKISLVATEYREDLQDILKDVDAIIHLSALRWWNDKTLGDYLANNVTPTNALYSAAAANGVRSIVFLSSIAVYNPQFDAIPFTEGNDLRPATHYGLSKLLSEKIGSYYSSQLGLKVKSLRVGQVVGSGEREGLLSTLLGNAASGQPLVIHGDGSGARDYVYMRDVIAAISCALSHPDVSGEFNISLGSPVSHLQLAETIKRTFGTSSPIVFSLEKTEDRRRLYMSCERAHRELGWEPQWDLDAMFTDLAAKWKKAGTDL